MRKINGRQINELADYDTRTRIGRINCAIFNSACNRLFESRGLPRYDFAGYRPKVATPPHSAFGNPHSAFR